MILLASTLLVLTAGPAPPFRTDGSLEPQDAVRRAALATWTTFAEVWERSAGKPPRKSEDAIHLTRGTGLAPGRNGASRPGLVEVRQTHEWRLDEATRTPLAHELVHQFLWSACPEASDDRLFHEAFAVALSGELAAWTADAYLSLPAAMKVLGSGASLDGASARQALARVITEDTPPGERLPRFVSRRLSRCGGAWEPVTLVELGSSVTARAFTSSFVVLSRHSGEVLVHEGDIDRPVPYGSTLKPFLVGAVRGATPVLPVGSGTEWACGDALPPQMNVEQALLRSCNGYFLEWARRVPALPALGAYGPVLQALGLARVPSGAAEAIGLTATLSLSPLRLAEAYRVLALDRPDVMRVLMRNSREGTLSGLGLELSKVAIKTGTVRDGALRPALGLIVGVDAEVVMVMTRAGATPRQFAAEFSRRVSQLPRGGSAATRVQVLGLLPPEVISLRCPRVGVVVTAAGPALMGAGEGLLNSLADRGPVLCLGAPFFLRVPGPFEGERAYAGSFEKSTPPPRGEEPGVPEGARRAREGSAFIFTTTRLAYVAGVLAAEDAAVTGPTRKALAKVILHNAAEPRHSGRPLCDTTHCQAFRGTVTSQAEERSAVEELPLGYPGWLPFARGGVEPWRAVRQRADVQRVLKASPVHLRFEPGHAVFDRAEVTAEGTYLLPVTVGCEVLRNPLKLPSCPDRATDEGATLVFEGHGEGHGLGLDVERAKASRWDEEEILERAYGKR